MTAPRRGRRVAAWAVLATGALLLTACGGGGTDAPQKLTVESPWARATPPGAEAGATYLTVLSPVDDVITGVDVPASVAADAQMHASMTTGGGGGMANMPNMAGDAGGEMTTMKPLTKVALPAGKAVVFEPGGRHIMLSGLRSGLEVGRSFPLTLHFRVAPDRTVRVTVSTNPP